MNGDPVLAFSILKRIERNATRADLILRSRQKSFQYPQTDRAQCDVPGRVVNSQPAKAFSILKRIERNATQKLSASTTRTTISFSILKRIERNATHLIPTTSRRLFVFQYPQTDRAQCDILLGDRSPH